MSDQQVPDLDRDPLLLLLGDSAQLVVGVGLFITVVEVDKDLQGLLVVLLGLRPLALLLCYPAQAVVGAGL